jgi:hypothetical protein
VSQLVAEVHDPPPRTRDCIESRGSETGERRDRLADDDELPLDGRTYEAVALVRCEIQAVNRDGDRVARPEDVR